MRQPASQELPEIASPHLPERRENLAPLRQAPARREAVPSSPAAKVSEIRFPISHEPAPQPVPPDPMAGLLRQLEREARTGSQLAGEEAEL